MDKKKKILAAVAVVLVGGIAALSATGSINNLRSSFWVDTGDGNGYWDYSDENINTPENPPVIVDTNTQYKSPELIKLEQEYGDLELASIELQKKKDEADLALNGPNGSQTKINKLLSNLDLYVCTKKTAYKDKGYKYTSVSEVENKLKALNSFITKGYPSTLSRLNAEFKKIPTKNTSDIQKKKAEIEALQKQKTAADEEKKAITDSTAKCITPAKNQIAQLEKTVKSHIDSLDKAQKELDENQKQKDENKKKQEDEKRSEDNSSQGNKNNSGGSDFIDGYGDACPGIDLANGTTIPNCEDIRCKLMEQCLPKNEWENCTNISPEEVCSRPECSGYSFSNDTTISETDTYISGEKITCL